MGISRAYFRLSDLAEAQHETALVQAVSKLLALGKTTEDKLYLYRAPFVALGTLLVTGVYEEGVFKAAVVTKIDDKDLPITTTMPSLIHGLPGVLS